MSLAKDVATIQALAYAVRLWATEVEVPFRPEANYHELTGKAIHDDCIQWRSNGLLVVQVGRYWFECKDNRITLDRLVTGTDCTYEPVPVEQRPKAVAVVLAGVQDIVATRRERLQLRQAIAVASGGAWG